jgi:mono/diheme cytochrome c family protein
MTIRMSALCGMVFFSMFAVVATAAPAKQLPDGPGKEPLERVCSACHGPEMVMGRGLTKDGWTQVVQDMVQRGAQGSEDDFNQIVDYLAKNFPPRSNSQKTASSAQNKK